MRNNSAGLDSHTESDEAVDDKGAMFQRRNPNSDYKNHNNFMSGGGRNGNMYGDDLDHTESEEGNNQDIPDFQGNALMFKKRGAVEGQSLAANSKGSK